MDVHGILNEIATHGDLDPSIAWKSFQEALIPYIDEVLSKHFTSPDDASGTKKSSSKDLNPTSTLPSSSSSTDSQAPHPPPIPSQPKPFFLDPLTKESFTREEMVSDVKQLIQTHETGPPFTVQRMAELLLQPNLQYPPTQEYKYLLALTRVLNVASSVAEFEDLDIIKLSEERERQAEERDRLERERENNLDEEDDFPFPMLGSSSSVTESRIIFGTSTSVFKEEHPQNVQENDKATSDKTTLKEENTSAKEQPPSRMWGLRSRSSSIPSTPVSSNNSSIVGQLNSVVVMSPISWINERIDRNDGDIHQGVDDTDGALRGRTLMEELADANSLLDDGDASESTQQHEQQDSNNNINYSDSKSDADEDVEMPDAATDVKNEPKGVAQDSKEEKEAVSLASTKEPSESEDNEIPGPSKEENAQKEEAKKLVNEAEEPPKETDIKPVIQKSSEESVEPAKSDSAKLDPATESKESTKEAPKKETVLESSAQPATEFPKPPTEPDSKSSEPPTIPDSQVAGTPIEQNSEAPKKSPPSEETSSQPTDPEQSNAMVLEGGVKRRRLSLKPGEGDSDEEMTDSVSPPEKNIDKSE